MEPAGGMHISTRTHALRPTAVNAVLGEVRAAQLSGRSLVSLMRGQPDTPTPPHIIAAAEKALRAGRTGYADNRGEPALRRAVAEKLQAVNGLEYDPETEILITDGATASLCAAMAVLVESGQGVVLPDPIYDAYHSPIVLWGARPLAARACVENGRYTIGREALAAAATVEARALLLNSPWNPVGSVFSAAELDSLIAFARERELTVVSDEIYEALVYDGRAHVSPAARSADARGRTIVVNSLSKTYAMTGWRVGYAAGPAPIIAAMLLVLQQWSRGPATFVQDAATCALEGDQACVAAMRVEYQARRDRVLAALEGIVGVKALVPEGGLFVMLDVRGLGRSDDEIRRFLLHESGVVVIHGSAYGPGGEGTLRISFAAGGQVLDQGLQRLREGLEQLAPSRS